MFYKYRRQILWLAKVIGVLPKPMLRWLYALTTGWSGMPGILIRYVILKNLCAELGDNVYVGSHVTVHFLERLRIGSNVSIHTQSYIDANGGIEIGNDVSIAHASSLVAFDHSWDDPETPIRKNPLIPAPIKIDNDVWIGAGVRVLAGAHIRHRIVVAAGAIVTRKLRTESGTLIGGVPARTLRTLTGDE